MLLWFSFPTEGVKRGWGLCPTALLTETVKWQQDRKQEPWEFTALCVAPSRLHPTPPQSGCGWGTEGAAGAPTIATHLPFGHPENPAPWNHQLEKNNPFPFLQSNVAKPDLQYSKLYKTDRKEFALLLAQCLFQYKINSLHFHCKYRLCTELYIDIATCIKLHYRPLIHL